MNTQPTEIKYPYPQITYKRGIFMLVAELPSGGHTYISTLRKKSFAQDEGYYLLMFNELTLANSYVYKFKEQLENGKSGADFPTKLILIQEILNQEHWDEVLKLLLSDNIKNGLINPCLEEKTKDHNCITRPIGFEKHTNFNELTMLFEKLPDTHVNVSVNDDKEIANVTVLDNY